MAYTQQRGARQAHPMSIKLEVLKRLRRGDRNVDIVKSMNLSESTVRTIRDRSHTIMKKVEEERQRIQTTTNSVERTEFMLSEWVKACNDSGVSLSKGQVTSKARKIYKQLTKNEDNAAPFIATEEWLNTFKANHILWTTTAVDVMNPGVESAVEPGELMMNAEEEDEAVECKPTYLVEHLDHETNLIQELGADHREDDTIAQFGKYITSLLRAFPPEHSIQMQKKIINLIAEQYPDAGSAAPDTTYD